MPHVSTLSDRYTITATSYGYMLVGKRGATYGLFRNVNNPAALFAVNSRGTSLPVVLDQWFTDAEVAR